AAVTHSGSAVRCVDVYPSSLSVTASPAIETSLPAMPLRSLHAPVKSAAWPGQRRHDPARHRVVEEAGGRSVEAHQDGPRLPAHVRDPERAVDRGTPR